ncbi:SHOCT domain-containing protein [Companilactobacillus mishanensis]|uniref:SHOCT domain-containing protein n=1 Tax=Companilactobacillus mishanensis TaxID=2486008 RepID=UPI000F7A2B2B|nr:SHOCT domain-containing protein [Companilactobacillus mishanensis]
MEKIKVEINIPEHVILEADDTKVTITRKGLRSFANRGSNGSQTIPFSTIIGIDFKPATLTAGHIGFTTAAGNQTTSGLGSQGIFANSDYSKANTIVYRSKKANKDIEAIKKRVDDFINTPKESNNSSTDSIDELPKLKKLLDAGILTQEEFDAKKKQILGL